MDAGMSNRNERVRDSGVREDLPPVSPQRSDVERPATPLPSEANIEGDLPKPGQPQPIDKTDPAFGKTFVTLLAADGIDRRLSAEEGKQLDEMTRILHDEIVAKLKEHPKVAKSIAEAAARYEAEGGFNGVFYGPNLLFGLRMNASMHPVIVVLNQAMSEKDVAGDKLPREVLGVPIEYRFFSGFKVGPFYFGHPCYRDTEGLIGRVPKGSF